LSARRGKRWIRTGLAATVAIVVVVAFQAVSTRAAPGVFSLDRLRLGGAGGAENYLYTAGNVIFPEGGADTGSYFKFVVTDQAGVTRNSPVCRPASDFQTADNAYTVLASDPSSTSAYWKYTLNQYTSATCSGTASKTAFKSFYVVRATAYADSALTTQRSVFRQGETAFVVVSGAKPGLSNWNTTWLLPTGAVACANTAGADRPESRANGRLPKALDAYLQYRPSPSGVGAWNRESNYETRPCVDLSASNQGAWKLRLQVDATDFVDLAAFTVDTTAPPAPTIDSRPADPNGATSASFMFSDSESGVSFLCQLDGASFAACISPKTYASLAEGQHTFAVKARDAAGNESSVTSYTWRVDTTPPAAPTIGTHPADPSNASNAGFSFSGEPGAGFLCRLDGAAFAACTSPASYSNLSEAQHTFGVKARDAAGNESGVTTFTWTVDVTPPGSPSIDSHPPDPSSSTSASFGFSGEAGATFTCQLDAGGFASCASPITYAGLTESSHSFQVKARDAAGNESAPSSYTWSIIAAPTVTLTQPADGSASNDTTPTFAGVAGTDPGDQTTVTVKVYAGATPNGTPLQTLIAFRDGLGNYAVDAAALGEGLYTAQAEQGDTAGNIGRSAPVTFTIDTTAPAAPAIGSHPADPTNATSASIAFSGDAGASFLCRLDGATFAACTSPKAYSALSEGTHSFQVKARDQAGNESAVTSFTWTIDLTAPAAPAIGSHPADPTNASSASFTFSGAAGASFLCRLDGATFAACTSPQAYSGLSEGTHSFQVKARDQAGNESAVTTFTWTIDLTAPAVTLEVPANLSTINDATPTLSGDGGSALGDLATVTVWIYAGSTPSGSPLQVLTTTVQAGSFAVDAPALPDGTYTARAQQADAAGNVGLSTANTFVIDTSVPDTTPPTVTLTQPADGSAGNDATPTFAGVAGTDPGDLTTVTVKVYTGATPTGTPLQALIAFRDGFGNYTVDAAALAEGLYTAQAEQSDAAGNLGRSAPVTFTVDLTAPAAPAIGSHPADPTNASSASFTFSGAAGASFLCRLDGTAFAACTSPQAYSGLGEGARSFQVKARDQAGNESAVTTFTWTVDLTAPTIILSTPANGSSSGVTTPVFSGTAGTASGDSTTVVVKVYPGSLPTGTPVQTLSTTRQSNGAYSVTASPALSEGTYTARAEQQDAVGNFGLSGANTFTIGTTYRDVVLADGPNSYWRLGESTGTTAADQRGANPGTYNGGVALGQAGALTGDANTSALFDGVNDYVVVPDANSLDLTTAVSVEAWVQRTKSAAYQVIVSKPGNGQSKFENYALWIDSANRLEAYFGDGVGFAQLVGPAIDTNWHHVVGTYDNATAKMYLDGSLRVSTSSSVHMTANALPLNIGRANGGGFFLGGRIDEVAVYPSILSAARVQAHYNAGIALDSQAPLVGLASPANGASTNDSTPTVTGTAGSASGDSATVTIKIYAGSSPTGSPVRTLTATRQPDASYSVEVVPGLAEGTYTAQAEQSDQAGNVGRSPANTFAIDTTAPAPVLTTPANGSLRNPPPTFAGNAGVGVGDAPTVTVKVYAGTDTSGSLVRTLTSSVGPGSQFSVDAVPPLTEGTFTAQVEQLDAAGNVGRSSANTFTLTTADVTPPSVALTAPADGSRTSDMTPTFSGTGGTASGDSTTVFVKVYAGSTPSGTPAETLAATRDAAGAFSVDSAILTDGIYTVQAEQSDEAGNVGRSPATFTIDTTPPTISLASPANGSSTNDVRPTVAGTAGTAAGDSSTATLRIYAGSDTSTTLLQTMTAGVGSGGAFSASVLANLDPGTYTAQASQSDDVGNLGLSSANTFTVTDDPAVFLTAGDIAGCDTSGDEATAAILDANPGGIVAPIGDTAYPNGQPSDFANCYDPSWGRAKARTRPMIGDHEYTVVQGGTAPGMGFIDYFRDQLTPFGPTATDPSKLYYSYNYGAWHIVVLNISCYENVAPGCNPTLQEQWFENDLAANTTACTAVMWHKPRFSSGSVHGDYFLSQQFWETAYTHGVELVLSGDDHEYERFAPMDAAGNADPQYGVRQWVVGTGGFSHYTFGTIQPNSEVRNSDTWGILKLTLHSGSYDWQFLPEAGHTFTDTGSTACHPPPPPLPPGAPAVRAASSATVNYPATSITIAKPAGAVQGDLLLAIVGHQAGLAVTLTPPAGWTEVPNTNYTDGNDVRIRAWYKFAGSAEPSSYTFTLSGSGQAIGGGILAVTGAAAAPINASGGQVSSTNSIYLTAPSITTTVDKTLLVYGGAMNQAAAFAPPAFMTERWDAHTTGTYNVGIEAATQVDATAGATGARTAYLYTGAHGPAILIAVAPSP
jgi:hypothetical protein